MPCTSMLTHPHLPTQLLTEAVAQKLRQRLELLRTLRMGSEGLSKGWAESLPKPRSGSDESVDSGQAVMKVWNKVTAVHPHCLSVIVKASACHILNYILSCAAGPGMGGGRWMRAEITLRATLLVWMTWRGVRLGRLPQLPGDSLHGGPLGMMKHLSR